MGGVPLNTHISVTNCPSVQNLISNEFHDSGLSFNGVFIDHLIHLFMKSNGTIRRWRKIMGKLREIPTKLFISLLQIALVYHPCIVFKTIIYALILYPA